MKIRLVCYEDPNLWILGKFAKNLENNLKKIGYNVDIDSVPDPNADINHHIIFSDYNGKINNCDTLMITHVDNIDKLNNLKKNLEYARLGICMSSETMYMLIQKGIKKEKLCYILPAHDEKVLMNKIVIGIFCRVQPDGRKREFFLDKLSKQLNSEIFKFIIMGDSWDKQVNILISKGFEVDYYRSFEPEKYYSLFKELNYYLYMGLDEGQMGVIDAHAAGVDTIVTSQGYHLDLDGTVTHPFTSYEDLKEIFIKIQNHKLKIINSVVTYKWYDYTIKHLECWKFLLGNKSINSNYKDGLNTIFEDSNNSITFKTNKSNFKLILNKYSQYYYRLKNKI